MLPLALINIVVAGLWRFMPPGLVRWAVCAMLVVGPYVLLGRALFYGGKFGPRTYRFADT